MTERATRIALVAIVAAALLAIAVLALPRLVDPTGSPAASPVPTPAAATPPDLTTVTGAGYSIGLPVPGSYSAVPAAGGEAWFGFGASGPQGVWVARLDDGTEATVADATAAAEELAALLGGMPGGATAGTPLPVELPVGRGQRIDVTTGNGRFVAVVLDTAAGRWRLLFVNEPDPAIDAVLRSFAPLPPAP